MKYSVTHNFATKEELVDHVNLISGVTSACTTPAEPATKAPKAGKKAAAANDATTGAATAGPAPAPLAPTIEQLKEQILKHHKNAATAEGKQQTMDFVAKHGAKKLSDMTDVQRTAAFSDASAYFGALSAEADPMA